MDGGRYRSKGSGMASAGKRVPYVLLLLLTLTAAALSVVVLHKVREQRAFAAVLQERDRQVVSLRILLQKEKAINKEMKRKVEELKATTSSLRTQKTDLKTQLKGLEATATNLKNTHKELESSLRERDSRINEMEERTTDLKNTKRKLEASLTERDSRINQLEEKAAAGSNPDQMAALMEILQRKEAELEEIKIRFQDHKIADRRKDAISKSIPVQTNNGNATPDVPVVKKDTKSSNTTIPATSEEKRPGNTTVTESKHKKVRSLEEKPVKLTGNAEDDDLEDKIGDVVEDIDDIYGESHSRKAESHSRNNFFLTNSQGEELDGIGQPGHSLDQDSDPVRYSKLLEKENNKDGETKKKKSTDGSLEKISKDSLNDANQKGSKQAVEQMAHVRPKMSVNGDGTEEQSKRHKKKKSKSKKKKMADIATVNGDGEVAKEKEVGATSIPE